MNSQLGFDDSELIRRQLYANNGGQVNLHASDNRAVTNINVGRPGGIVIPEESRFPDETIGQNQSGRAHNVQNGYGLGGPKIPDPGGPHRLGETDSGENVNVNSQTPIVTVSTTAYRRNKTAHQSSDQESLKTLFEKYKDTTGDYVNPVSTPIDKHQGPIIFLDMNMSDFYETTQLNIGGFSEKPLNNIGAYIGRYKMLIDPEEGVSYEPELIMTKEDDDILKTSLISRSCTILNLLCNKPEYLKITTALPKWDREEKTLYLFIRRTIREVRSKLCSTTMLISDANNAWNYLEAWIRVAENTLPDELKRTRFTLRQAEMRQYPSRPIPNTLKTIIQQICRMADVSIELACSYYQTNIIYLIESEIEEHDLALNFIEEARFLIEISYGKRIEELGAMISPARQAQISYCLRTCLIHDHFQDELGEVFQAMLEEKLNKFIVKMNMTEVFVPITLIFRTIEKAIMSWRNRFGHRPRFRATSQAIMTIQESRDKSSSQASDDENSDRDDSSQLGQNYNERNLDEENSDECGTDDQSDENSEDCPDTDDSDQEGTNHSDYNRYCVICHGTSHTALYCKRRTQRKQFHDNEYPAFDSCVFCNLHSHRTRYCAHFEILKMAKGDWIQTLVDRNSRRPDAPYFGIYEDLEDEHAIHTLELKYLGYRICDWDEIPTARISDGNTTTDVNATQGDDTTTDDDSATDDDQESAESDENVSNNDDTLHVYDGKCVMHCETPDHKAEFCKTYNAAKISEKDWLDRFREVNPRDDAVDIQELYEHVKMRAEQFSMSENIASIRQYDPDEWIYPVPFSEWGYK